MRIVFVSDGVYPHSVGGMQRHTTSLANALTRAGAEVEVVVPAGHEDGDFAFTPVPLDWPATRLYPLTLRRWAAQVSAAIDWQRYDVVYGQGLTLWGLLPRHAPPSVYNPHGLELCTTGTTIGDLKAWPLRVGARSQAAQAVFTISLGGRLADLAVSCLGVPRERIRVVPNAVDLSRFADTVDEERDPRLVLFVGRLFENKGLDILVEAATLLPDDVEIAIVGDGPLRPWLEAQHEPRLRIIGSTSETELHRLYRRASVLVVPSRSDGMPTVILEAFACGTPVVATDVGAVAELVGESTGVLLGAPEPTAVAAGIRRVLELHAPERASLGEAAARLVREKFTWEAVARRTIDVLDDALAVGTRGGAKPLR